MNSQTHSNYNPANLDHTISESGSTHLYFKELEKPASVDSSANTRCMHNQKCPNFEKVSVCRLLIYRRLVTVLMKIDLNSGMLQPMLSPLPLLWRRHADYEFRQNDLISTDRLSPFSRVSTLRRVVPPTTHHSTSKIDGSLTNSRCVTHHLRPEHQR
jgi:hypothetical protein